jgi:hypothetical protein
MILKSSHSEAYVQSWELSPTRHPESQPSSTTLESYFDRPWSTLLKTVPTEPYESH